MDRRGIVLVHGLGDTITCTHLMNSFLRGEENYLIQSSYRPEFIVPFVELVIPHLPNGARLLRDEEFEGRWAVPFHETALKYQAKLPGLHLLQMGRNPFMAELLTKHKFDFQKLVTASPLEKLTPYAVVSVDVLKKDRVMEQDHWQWACRWLMGRGITPVVVGKKSPSTVDRRFGDDVACEFPEGVVDMRENTPIAELINIMAHAEAVISPVNAIAHLAWELKRPALCLGAANKTRNYQELYFIGYEEQKLFRINYDRDVFRTECSRHLGRWLRRRV